MNTTNFAHARGVVPVRLRAAMFAILAAVVVARPGIVAAQSLPASWSSADLGNVTAAGSVDRTSCSTNDSCLGFAVTPPEGIANADSDRLRFVYRQLTGDGAIVARLASVGDVPGSIAGGVMMREALTADSRETFLAAGPGGIVWQSRTATGAAATKTAVAGNTPPVWLRIERRGTAITASQSPDGSSWSTVGVATMTLPSTVYVGVAATAIAAASVGPALIDNIRVETLLPGGWTYDGIGLDAVSGDAAFEEGTLTVNASGEDVWWVEDHFAFVYRRIVGDVDVVTRVSTLTGSQPWAKAGLMLRASLESDAANAFLGVTYQNGIILQGRPEATSPSVLFAHEGGAAPAWLKIERRGSSLTAFRSPDGVSWTMVGSETLDLPSSFYVGVALTSHDVGSVATATFTGLGVSAIDDPSNAPPTVSLVASPATGIKSGDRIALAASATDADGSITGIDLYDGDTLIASTGSSRLDAEWTAASPGARTLIAVAHDDRGAASGAPVVLTITEPAELAPVESQPQPAAAVFLKYDAATQGGWRGVYGNEAVSILRDVVTVPDGMVVHPTAYAWTWEASTDDSRALENGNGSGRQASAWYDLSTSFEINLPGSHQLAMYMVDWDHNNRTQRIDVMDAETGAVLDSRDVTAFDNGKYIVWRVRGHVIVRVTCTSGPNAVVSGVFIDPAAADATFLRTDDQTKGTWQGIYGSVAFALAADRTQRSANVDIAPSGDVWIWDPSALEDRALQLASGDGRRAATWFGDDVTVDVNVGDMPRRVAVYVVDWDSPSRAMSVEVTGVADGRVLDRRSIDGFSGGKYLVWEVTGQVRIRFVCEGGANAVFSGVFIDPRENAPVPLTPTPHAPSVEITSPVDGATFGNHASIAVTASAADVDGAVTSVAFFLNGRSLGAAVSSSPYSAMLADVAPGEYVVTAVATDDEGLSTTSAPVTIEIPVEKVQAAAAFVRMDPSTRGNWVNSYGHGGFLLASGEASSREGSSLLLHPSNLWTWEALTTDVRGLQDSHAASRQASTWFGGQLEFDVDVVEPQQIAVYMVDWDHNNRAERIELLDADSGRLLDSREVRAYDDGQYGVWRVVGHLTIRVTNLQGPNAVVSGVFIDDAPAGMATFISTDDTTKGTWRDKYGSNAFAVAADRTQVPSGEAITPTASLWTWEGDTTDERGLQVTDRESRHAATWYNEQMTVDVVAGNTPARLALYAVDWDRLGRVQQIDILDGATGTVLDTQRMADFAGGRYEIWQVTGHVKIRITDLVGPNAVVSAIFLDPAGSFTPPPAVNVPPIVSLSATVATATAPGALTLTAAANDADGTVTRVDFYAGSTLIGSSSARPFSVGWTNVPAGTYMLTAVAVDDGGATTVSAPVPVEVADVAVAPPPDGGPIQQPWLLEFVPSVDDATSVLWYEVEIRAVGNTSGSVAFSRSIGKPLVLGDTVKIDMTQWINALSSGDYSITVYAVNSAGRTPSSNSASFAR